MALRTYGFNVKGSFNNLLATHLATIQSEINAALGTSYSIAHYPQKNPETFPSVRSYCYLTDEPLERRNRLADSIQIDIFIKNPNPSMPDDRLMQLIRDNINLKLGITCKRGVFHAYFDVKDYFTNPTTPRTINRCRLETITGWQDLPDSDPDIARLQTDFKLIHI